MREKKSTLSALIWATVLVAPLVVAANSQTSATGGHERTTIGSGERVSDFQTKAESEMKTMSTFPTLSEETTS
ncbi:MAG TPA: hypothetical protein VGV87_08150 [Blastocatellia bacterium]|jgi:hypothetical protein|nr:hypothetical protein [Blastocatellia bacterium]